MILTIYNPGITDRTYLSGSVAVPANGEATAAASVIFSLARDPNLLADCLNGDVYVGDSVKIYRQSEATAYLDRVATSIAGAVVGLAGANAPSFQIMVGGKDPSGLSQPARLNRFGDLSVSGRNGYQNITGNGTTVVKSGAGTLHGIIINDDSTNGTVTIYDNTAGSGTKIATLSIGSPSGGLLSTSGIPGPRFIGPLALEFSTGLTIVTAGSSQNNITAVYQ